MIIEHPIDDGRGILPCRNHPASPRCHAVMLSQVDPRQVYRLYRRSTRHRTDLDGRHNPRPTARHLEVQVIIQRCGSRILPLQQL
ncbi:hypothetical protein D3C78_1841340 [compost metagenome]